MPDFIEFIGESGQSLPLRQPLLQRDKLNKTGQFSNRRKLTVENRERPSIRPLAEAEFFALDRFAEAVTLG